MTQIQVGDTLDELSTVAPGSTATTPASNGPDENTPTVPLRRRMPVAALVAGAIVLLAAGFFTGRASAPDDTANPPSAEAMTESGEPDAAKLLSVGMALHNSGDLSAAEKAYQQVLVLAAEDPYALYNLGLIRHTQGDLAAALGFYDRSLASDSTLVSAQYNRALARRDTGNAAGAIDDLEAVVAAQPENAGALYNLGNLTIAGGDIDGGTKLVNQAIEIDPSLRGDQ